MIYTLVDQVFLLCFVLQFLFIELLYLLKGAGKKDCCQLDKTIFNFVFQQGLGEQIPKID